MGKELNLIIDIHYHQIPQMLEELIPHTLEDPIRAARQIGLDVNLDQLTAKDSIQIIRDLPRNAPEGIQFSEAEVSAILGGNAKKILGLSNS